MIEFESSAGATTITITPNASLRPRHAAFLWSGLTGYTLFVAGFFTALGAWPVLPFAGGEVLLLLGCLAWAMRDNTRREVITIKETRVVVKRHCAGWSEVACDLERTWVRVDVRPPRVTGHAARLLIGSHGRFFEIAKFLAEPDKSSLASRLRSELR